MPLERIYRYMNNMTSWQKYALTLPVKYNTFSDNQLVIYQLLEPDMSKTFQALRYFFHCGQNKTSISAKEFPFLVWAGGHEAQIKLSH